MSLRAGLLGLLLVACGDEVTVWDGDPYRHDPPPVGALHGRVVTTNNFDDTLSIVDPSTPGAAPRRLPIGFSPVELEGPHHVAADPQGRFIYVNLSLAVEGSGSGPHGSHGSGELPGYVLKIDARDGRTVASVQVDPNPGDNVLSADGGTLFVTHYDAIAWARGAREGDLRKGDSNLVLVDTAAMRVKARVRMCPAAHGVRLSADEATLYATCGPDEIAVVDLRASPPTARRVPLPGAAPSGQCISCPYALAIAPDGTVWVSNLGPAGGRGGRGSLMVFDPKLPGTDGGGFDPQRTVLMRGSPVFATFLGDASAYKVYVPEQGQSTLEDWVRIYDPEGPGRAPRELASLRLDRKDCVLAHMLLAWPDGRAQLICEGQRGDAGQFVWLGLEPLRVLGSVPIGQFPDGLAYVPMPR